MSCLLQSEKPESFCILSSRSSFTICRPLSSCAYRRTLRFSVHGNLVVPFARSATMQSRSFDVVGPTTGNGLPNSLPTNPNGACSQFHQLLRLFFSAWNEQEAPLSTDLEEAIFKFLLIE